MRDYEMMLILHPDLDAQAIKSVVDGVSSRIGRDGEVTRADMLGRRKLTYPMRKVNQGVYTLFNFKLPPASIDGLKQFLQVDNRDTVLRYLLLIDEKRAFQPPTQAMPEEAPAAAAAAVEEAPQIVIETGAEAEAPAAAVATAEAEPEPAAVNEAAAESGAEA